MPSKGKSGVSKKRLNVICHGLMVFWFNSKTQKVTIRIPRVPGHSYGAGNLMLEQAIAPGTTKRGPLVLKGVTAGRCSTVCSDQRIVLDRKNGALQADFKKLHRSIEIPFPDDVLSFRFADAPPGGFFSGTAQKKYKVNPNMLPNVHVFTYEHFSNAKLRDNTEILWTAEGSGTRNLHIFAEPYFHGENHWHHLTGSFKGGLDLHVTKEPTFFEGPSGKGSKYGISAADMKSLQERRGLINTRGGPPPNCMPGYVL